MRSTIYGLLMLALASLFILSGCGGGGSSTPNNIAKLLVYSDPACTVPTDAAWVAFQDGANGPWVPITKTATGVYQAPVTNADKAYGFAAVSADGDVFIRQATLTDSPTIPLSLASFRSKNLRLPFPATRMAMTKAVKSPSRASGDPLITGTFAGVPDGGVAWVIDGQNQPAAYPAGAFSYAAPVTGQQDFGALLFTELPSELVPTALYLRRGLDVPTAGIDLGTIDFGTAGQSGSNVYPMPPNRPMPSMTNVRGSLFNSGLLYVTRGNTVISPQDGAQTYFTIPSAAQVSGDRYLLMTMESVDPDHQVGVFSTSSTPPTSLALPDPFESTCTAQDTITFGGLSRADADAYFMLAQTAGSIWSVQVSAAWLRANSAATSYTLPTFAGLTGWNTAWNCTANQLDAYGCSEFGYTNMSYSDFLDFQKTGDYLSLPADVSVQYSSASHNLQN